MNMRFGPELREKVREEYVEGKNDPNVAKIAAKFDMEPALVRQWIREGKWSQQRMLHYKTFKEEQFERLGITKKTEVYEDLYKAALAAVEELKQRSLQLSIYDTVNLDRHIASIEKARQLCLHLENNLRL